MKCGRRRPERAGARRIRDLNDEINKLIREKGHWEVRILDLGGPDYARSAPKAQDSEGNEIRGATGKGAGYRRGFRLPPAACCPQPSELTPHQGLPGEVWCCHPRAFELA